MKLSRFCTTHVHSILYIYYNLILCLFVVWEYYNTLYIYCQSLFSTLLSRLLIFFYLRLLICCHTIIISSKESLAFNPGYYFYNYRNNQTILVTLIDNSAFTSSLTIACNSNVLSIASSSSTHSSILYPSIL